MQKNSQAGRQNFLSGTLYPSPDISACGSQCGSGRLTHTVTYIKFRKTATKTPEIIRFREFSGAAGRIRTADLILTKDALYRLSYSSKHGDPERARTVDL